MKRLIIFYLFTLSVSVYSQQPHVQDTILNKIDKDGRKQGHWIKKDNKGFIIYNGWFENDKPYGTFIFMHPNGKMKSTTYYWKGTTKAFTQVFNTEGRKVGEGKVVGETKDSTWKFYENDVLVLLENYSLGKRNGVTKKYYKNGKLMDEHTFNNDVLNGPVKMYFPDEKLKMQGNVVKGLYEGKSTFYHANGKVQTEGSYMKDYKEGKWIRYLEDGSLEMEVVYKKSKEIKKRIMNAVIVEYHQSGMPKTKTTFKNGFKNGLYVEYYDAGERKKEEVPATKDGYPAEMKEVFVGQKEAKKGNYKNDKLDGKFTYYKLDSTVEKEEMYKDGVLVK